MAIDNGVPFTFECRTLVVSRDHDVIYDSQAHGIPDGYGCLVDGGCFAILRRTRWDLLILTQTGQTLERIDLSAVSKHIPRSLNWTDRGTFLITFLTRSHQLDMVELDRAGRVLWYLPNPSGAVGVPGSMQLLPSDSILMADGFRHVVQELRRDGSQSVVWGQWASPSADLRHLSSPRCAKRFADGSLLIADTNNHRVLNIDSSGTVSRIEPENNSWFAPIYVDRLENGNFLVCDQDNRCVMEINSQGQTAWRAGKPVATRRHFSFPRSVEYLGNDSYLIADTASNRVVDVRSNRSNNHYDIVDRPYAGETPLFWPRSAQSSDAGSLVIADGRNSRVLQLSPEGRVTHELMELRHHGQRLKLKDPHDARLLPNLNVLITDASQNLVVETNWRGEIEWAMGLDDPDSLKDPHSAQPLADGRVVISDSDNHRILVVDPKTNTIDVITELRSGSSIYRLHLPRYAELAAGDILLIVDTGNNRLLAGRLDGELIWELSQVPDSRFTNLRQPRWAYLIGPDEVLISDHFHHRIVHMRTTEG
jgi:outer membrane protein assembly factor BamB